jgi:hypothetical protein
MSENDENAGATWVIQRTGSTGVVMMNVLSGGWQQAMFDLPPDVAAALANRQTAYAARAELKKKGLKRAVEHFDYFLNGTGNVQKFSDGSGNQYTGVKISINDLVRSDTGVRDRLLLGDGARPGLLKRLANPAYVGKGQISVEQRHYRLLDWQYSLGAINMDYEITRKGVPPGGPRRVLLSFRNMYAWHPDDDSRWSQPIHAALKKLIGRHELNLQNDGRGNVVKSNGKVVVLYQQYPVAEYEMVGLEWNTGEDNVKAWPQGTY